MFSDIAAAGAPMDQWDALPSAAKLQILGTIFILEWMQEPRPRTLATTACVILTRACAILTRALRVSV